MSSRHGPYGLGYTRATLAITKGYTDASLCQSQKSSRSSDQSLKLMIVKLESQVIVDHLRNGEYVTESSTHRPSRLKSSFNLKF